MNEEWKHISETNNKFMISNFGRIKYAKSNKIYPLNKIPQGYLYAGLRSDAMDKITFKRLKREQYFQMDRAFNALFRSGRIVNVLRFPITTIYSDHDSTGVGMMTPILIVKTKLLDTELVLN